MARAQRLRTTIRHFARDDSGATAIEYALVGAGIAGVIAGIVYTLGNTIKTTFFEVVSTGLQ